MTPIAFLVAQHPAINHAVILREIRELRKHFGISTISVRAPDRPVGDLSEEERDEAARTHFIIPQGPRGAIAGVWRTLLRRPVSLAAGYFHARRRGGLRGIFSYSAYFVEAVMVGDWMERNGLRHLHIHYSSTIGLIAKKIFPIDISVSIHGPDEFRDVRSFRMREKIEACTWVRAISSYARSQLLECCTFEHWGKIRVAYMAVDTRLFPPRPFRANPQPFEIICVGRLARVKAQHVLISAVAKLAREGREVLLHVVGGGPDRQSLEEHVDSLGVRRNVVFHGFTPQEKLDGLYRQADVFALASFAEGLPGVLMEAMAGGIPCVATWINGVPELIRDGIDGLLAPAGDVEAFAGALARLMDDEGLRRRIAEQGRERIADRFELEKNAAALASIFQEYVK